MTNRLTPVLVSGLTGATAIAASHFSHSLAVKAGGTVLAWGFNCAGELGDGIPVQRSTPAQVNGLTGEIGLSAGDWHNLMLKPDGTVWAWGYNYCGELGNGTAVYYSTPGQVSGLTGATAVSAGDGQSLAIKGSGTSSIVQAWGMNGNSELGDGTTTNRSTPVQVSGLTGATAISAGSGFSLAIKGSGASSTIQAWGSNSFGQLGDGTTTNRSKPVQVSGLTGVTAAAAGTCYSIALMTNGTVRAWGRNNYGQLGSGTTTDSVTPVQVSGLTGVTAIAVGESHSLALKSDGTVWAWGLNNYGQLGDGTTANRLVPVQVNGLTGVIAISAGTSHSLALKSDGTVWAWGLNNYGQLGDGTTTNRSTPVQVSGLTDVIALEAGKWYSFAIRGSSASNITWAWGDDYYGQLGQGRIVQASVPFQTIMPFEAKVLTGAPQSRFGTEEVNLSGNLSRSYTDLSFNAPGFTLNVGRTYNSSDTRTGPISQGWTFSFEGRLEVSGTTYTIYMPNGSANRFELKNGVYEAQDSRATLVKTNTTTFTLATKDHYTYTYYNASTTATATRYLNTMTDPNGNKVNITVDASGQVSGISDQAGRSVTVNYTSGRISSIGEATTGRSVTYGYTTVAGAARLTSVLGADGSYIYYTYDTSNGKLINVKNSNNVVVESFTYGSVGNDVKVLSVTYPTGNTESYYYDMFWGLSGQRREIA